ncbi:hypothetical protein [Streptomyces sp. NBC_00829]|uniref:hypothetical protein n=1 Tax=Streptomyces sp. NBC_00829 TaxID=2903679 RepID=UPI003868EBB5|nr:hypothetical protein OG293_14845 [Streptomyces sp. NBC_00829]
MPTFNGTPPAAGGGLAYAEGPGRRLVLDEGLVPGRALDGVDRGAAVPGGVPAPATVRWSAGPPASRVAA